MGLMEIKKKGKVFKGSFGNQGPTQNQLGNKKNTAKITRKSKKFSLRSKS